MELSTAGFCGYLAAVIHSGQADDLIMRSPFHVTFEGSSGEEYSYQKIIYPDYGHMLPLKKDVMKCVLEWL